MPPSKQERWKSISPLLDELLDADDAQRAARLAEVRQNDPELADEVAEMLAKQAAIESEDFLSGSVLDLVGSTSLEGKVVGNYTLDSLLGQGGMGSVWLAHRSDGRFEGQAAVKFLNLALMAHGGADRFRREGSVLARLAHPHIGRLLDAGVAAGGQPYLVLEYIPGDPIDKWCNDRALDTRARLKLFIDVLEAVGHAHSNLILHRDLKPSNILVTQDGQVKLLDFGIAKLLDTQSQATAPTELTRAEGRAFTPDFAAPEQIQDGNVTTATDVYALGVLLYMLLVGVHPTGTGTRTPVERLRAIAEVEPTRPSDAVLRAEPVTGLPAPKQRARALRGDLDNIVTKALRKVPGERYPSVEAFAQDIERHLDGRPVLARPDSRWYRTRKFVVRNALAVGAVSTIVVTTLAGAAVALWQADTARVEAAKAQAVQGFLTDVFLANTYEQADPLKAQNTTARELLTIGAQRMQKGGLSEAPEVRVELLGTLGGLMHEFGLADEAVKLERSRVDMLRGLHGQTDTRVASGLLRLAEAMETSASTNDRDAVIAEAQKILDTNGRIDPPLRAELAFQLAKLLQERDLPKTLAYAREAAALFAEQKNQSRAAESLALEGATAEKMGNTDVAERAYRESLAIVRTLERHRNRVLPYVLIGLAGVLSQQLRIDDADAYFREGIAVTEKLFGREHELYLDTIYNYGTFLGQNSRSREALPFLREAADTHRRVRGDNEAFHQPKYLTLLGVVTVEHGRAEEAEPLLARAVQLKRDSGRANLALAGFLHLASRAPMEAGDVALATARLDEALAIISRHDPKSVRDLITINRGERARVALRANRPGEARELMRLVVGDSKDGPRTRPELNRYILLAETEAASGDMAAAERTSRDARAAIERLGLARAAAREVARIEVIEGKVALSRADAEAATTLLRRSLAVRKELLDQNSTLIAESLAELARARRMAGDTREAQALLREARGLLAAHATVPPQFARLVSDSWQLAAK